MEKSDQVIYHKIKFGTLSSNGKLSHVKEIKQSDIGQCKFFILVLNHYRDNGSCKCSNKKHREMMIKKWGYKTHQFKNINLID